MPHSADTTAQPNSALPTQDGDAVPMPVQSKTENDAPSPQNSKHANQSAIKNSNDNKGTEKELFYTQTDAVSGRFDFDPNPAPLAAEPSCHKIARQSIKHMGTGTIALSDSAITKTTAAIAGARALSQQLEHSESLSGLIPCQQYSSCAVDDIKHVPLVYMCYKHVKTKAKQRSAFLAARDWIKQQAAWRAQAHWDKAKFTELKTAYLQNQGKKARKTPQTDADKQEQQAAPQKKPAADQGQNQKKGATPQAGTSKDSSTKKQGSTRRQAGSKQAAKPKQDAKPTGDSSAKQQAHDEKSAAETKDAAPARPAKVKLMPQSADRLCYCSLTQEYLNTKNFRVFTGKTNAQGTCIIVKQIQDTEQNQAKQDVKHQPAAKQVKKNKAKQGVKHQPAAKQVKKNKAKQGVKHQPAAKQVKKNKAKQGVKHQPAAKQVKKNKANQAKKENKPKIDIQLKARAPFSDGLIHPVTLHIDCNQQEHYEQWRELLAQANDKDELGIKYISLVYQNLHASPERMVKRLVVASCLPGISPFIAKQAIKAFGAWGIDTKDEKKMAAWRVRKVALDFSQKSVAVVTSNDKQYYCFYQDILNLDNKNTAKQWRKLQLKYEQDQRAFSNYLAKINPKFYDEQGRRMTQDEAWTKFGLTEEFLDKRARSLLNVLRDDYRKIAQLRQQAQHKIICMLLPLGGHVIVEKTNFSGLAKRRSVSDGGNDVAALSADAQANSDLAATALQIHYQATRGADNKGTLVCGTNPGAGSNIYITESASGDAAADGRQEQQAVTPSETAQAQVSAQEPALQPSATNQSSAPNLARQAPKSRPGFGRSINHAAPAAFLKAYSNMLAKFGGVLIYAPTNQLKATQRNPLLKVDDPRAFQKLKGGLTQRYKRVIVPHELHRGKKELAIYVKRDFMAAFTLLHAFHNPDLNPDKNKKDELNDVDVAACRKEFQLFLRGYSHAMLHLCDKGLCSDNVKQNLRPSKFDLGAHDWHWGIKARSQIQYFG